MVFIYQPRNSFDPVDHDRCCASVWGGFRSSQCRRKVAVRREFDGVERGFCKQHDPVAEEARQAARRAKWDAEADAQRRQWERDQATRNALEACKAAVEKIASGHNDARALAAEALALFPRD